MAWLDPKQARPNPKPGADVPWQVRGEKHRVRCSVIHNLHVAAPTSPKDPPVAIHVPYPALCVLFHSLLCVWCTASELFLSQTLSCPRPFPAPDPFLS